MVHLALAALLMPVSYGFAEGTRLTYDFQATFEGLIPILGGQEGKAEVQMTIGVEGRKADAEGNLRAVSEVKDAKLLFNEAPLPLTVDSIRDFFPKTTVSFTAQGKTLKSDAPDRNVPVKLPGLDAKRFPEITYLPIEFPAGGVEVGAPWSYKRRFGDSDLEYECVCSEATDSTVKLGVKVKQVYEVLEDEALNVVKDQKDAVARVKTTMTGTGTGEFDRKLGVFRIMTVKTSAESVVTDLESAKQTSRKLDTSVSIKLKPD